MYTAAILIGNSDDKLTQKEWSEYVTEVTEQLLRWNCAMHFHGTSNSAAPWQNACWVFMLSEDSIGMVRKWLGKLATKYRQDSIAFMLGGTDFVNG